MKNEFGRPLGWAAAIAFAGAGIGIAYPPISRKWRYWVGKTPELPRGEADASGFIVLQTEPIQAEDAEAVSAAVLSIELDEKKIQAQLREDIEAFAPKFPPEFWEAIESFTPKESVEELMPEPRWTLPAEPDLQMDAW